MKGLSRSKKDFRYSRGYLVCVAFLLLLLTSGCTYQVNSLVDAPDANPGDGKCESAEGLCTLRAAVMEINA